MSEVPLRRRIPPKSIEELTDELLGNADISVYDARIIAKATYDEAMNEIYRLARVGEEYERHEATRKDLIVHWLERDPREPFHG